MNERRFVYILRSDSHPGRHYVGLTTNVQKRVIAHNAGQSPHTRKACPWSLIVAIEFATQEKAIALEKYLKTGSGRAFATRHFA